MLYVTGITGHSGRWFFERLKSDGFEGKIRCAVLEGADTSFFKNTDLDLEIVVGDLNNQEFLNSTMVGCRIVLHIASIFYSKNVIRAAVLNNLEWAILVHTTGRYSKYKSASAEYIAIDESVSKFRDKIGITILRPTMIYGSSRDLNMFKLISFLHKVKFFPMFGDGLNLMQPVYARDLGNAYYDVIINRSKTFNKEYNLPGEHPLPYIDLVRIVSKALERKNKIIKLPLWIVIPSAKCYNTLFNNPIISVEQVLRMQEDKAFGYEDAVNDFGYSPVSFEQGIIEEVNEYLEMSGNRREKGK